MWQKSVGISGEAHLRIVAFHVKWSFLGSIRNLMKRSGIEDLFIEVHAENTVSQGKLFEEPCTEAVLVTLLLEKGF